MSQDTLLLSSSYCKLKVMARGSRSSASASLTAALPSLLTNRASSYVTSRERILPSIKCSCIHCHSSFRRPTEPELRAQRRDSDLCATRSSTNADGKNSSSSFDTFKEIAAMPDIRLRPILTKPAEKEVPLRRVKVRLSSPWIGIGRSKNKKKKKVEEEMAAVLKQRRAVLWGSAVVVKLSCDPARDFMESMVEMITENGIREVAELKELLACYLTLNSEECHGVIIEVFEQILLLLINLHLL